MFVGKAGTAIARSQIPRSPTCVDGRFQMLIAFDTITNSDDRIVELDGHDDRPVDPDVQAKAAGKVVKESKKKKAKRKRRKYAQARAPPDATAFSFPQFCRAHNISLGMLYKLLDQGKGPAVMIVGARKLVSIEAAAAWRRQREAETQQQER